MNDTKLAGRSIYLPRGRDRVEDRCILSDCIAGSSAGLFQEGDSIFWIAGGQRVDVNLDVLRDIIQTFIVTKHPRQLADGSWEVEFRSYAPDEKAIHALIMAKRREEGNLAARLPKAAG